MVHMSVIDVGHWFWKCWIKGRK